MKWPVGNSPISLQKGWDWGWIVRSKSQAWSINAKEETREKRKKAATISISSNLANGAFRTNIRYKNIILLSFGNEMTSEKNPKAICRLWCSFLRVIVSVKLSIQWKQYLEKIVSKHSVYGMCSLPGNSTSHDLCHIYLVGSTLSLGASKDQLLCLIKDWTPSPQTWWPHHLTCSLCSADLPRLTKPLGKGVSRRRAATDFCL